MIKHEHITKLYDKHNIESRAELNLNMLKNDSIKHHSIGFDEEFVSIKSLDADSPFYEIPIKNIAGIEELPHHTAIILRNSILFLNKSNNDIHVHINIEKPTLIDRIKHLFHID